MRYLILFAIIMLTLTEDIKCPVDIDTTVSCTKEYIPVCGYSSEDYQQGTFENSCFACRTKNVIYYKPEPCLVYSVPPETSTSTNTNSNSSTVSSTNSIYKCDAPKVDNPICPEYYKQTCGLFNNNIQCIKAPCGQEFSNECFACANANIDTYFFGNCNELPKEEPTPPIEGDYIKCSEPRPEMCTLLYSDTCAFTEFPCYSDSCMKLTGSGCQACSDKTVVGYVQQSCQKYQQIYQSNMADDQGEETEDLTKNDEIQYQCSLNRPTNCDDIVNEVCASQICNDTICKKEYSNECQACLDSATTSYSKGKCDAASSGTLLGLAFIMHLFI